MNYLLLILVVLLLLGALDLLPAPKHMHYGLWLIAFFFTAITCSIKYFYGVDVSNYFIFYTDYPTLGNIWVARGLFEDEEIGFYIFSCLCKNAGLSFYHYTVLISAIFWTAVFFLLRKIEKHRVFALLCLFVCNKDLIFEQYRQSMAVACLIFAYLAYDNRRYIIAALMLLLMVTFHRSGMAIIGIVGIALVLQYFRLSYKWYFALIGIMLLGMTLNTTAVVQLIYDHIDTSVNASAQASSIAEHFVRARKLQVILPVYVAMMLALAEREKQNGGRLGLLGAFVLIAAAIIAVLYPYYQMLGRIRSYLMPFVLIAIMQYLDREEPLQTARQRLCSFRIPIMVCTYVVMGYMANVLITRHNIAFDTTILDVNTLTAKSVRDKKLHQAHYYWNYEFEKEQANDVKARKR